MYTHDLPARPVRRYDHIARSAGRLVCWALAAAIALSAIEAFVQPRAVWWVLVWLNAWTLFVLSLLCWVVARTLEKAEPSHAEHGPTRRDQAPAEDLERTS
ncbi:hypothetical protein [Streptomyces wuyuanensis]|uniref:hypothetical protein n=1 Tax=Streptomyces wuyuanensis TaxID=1196353 RepID=UPI003696EDF4